MFQLIHRLVPPGLHRTALRVAHGLRKRWWRLAQVQLSGCRVVARDPAGRVLLVRHSYGSRRWMLPGGGIARGEDGLTAATRELREETGCRLAEARLVELVEEPLAGTINRVHVVTGITSDQPQADGRELIDARFFAADALPDNLARGLAEALPSWLAGASADH